MFGITVKRFLPALALAAMAADSGSLPLRIPSTGDPTASVWLSASAAAGKDSKAALATLPSTAALAMADRTRAKFATTAAAQRIEEHGPVSAADCIEFLMPTPPDRHAPSGSLKDLTANSRAIFAGKIHALESGFFGGVPATLLSVTPTEWMRTDRSLHHVTSFLIPYSVGRFHIKDNLFCGGLPENPIPRVGDRLVVFVAPEAVTPYFPALLVAPQELVFAAPNGQLVVGGPLRQDPAMQAVKDFASLVETLRQSRGPRF